MKPIFLFATIAAIFLSSSYLSAADGVLIKKVGEVFVSKEKDGYVPKIRMSASGNDLFLETKDYDETEFRLKRVIALSPDKQSIKTIDKPDADGVWRVDGRVAAAKSVRLADEPLTSQTLVYFEDGAGNAVREMKGLWQIYPTSGASHGLPSISSLYYVRLGEHEANGNEERKKVAQNVTWFDYDPIGERVLVSTHDGWQLFDVKSEQLRKIPVSQMETTEKYNYYRNCYLVPGREALVVKETPEARNWESVERGEATPDEDPSVGMDIRLMDFDGNKLQQVDHFRGEIAGDLLLSQDMLAYVVPELKSATVKIFSIMDKKP